MAKLYAEITSDKGGRKVSKGGDKNIQIKVSNKNKVIYYVDVIDDGDECPQIIVSGETRLLFEN